MHPGSPVLVRDTALGVEEWTFCLKHILNYVHPLFLFVLAFFSKEEDEEAFAHP
jgi:hypothetical protein